MFILDCSS